MYDQKNINTKKQTKKSFTGIPDKIEDMSPRPVSPNKKNRHLLSPSNGSGQKDRVYDAPTSPHFN